MSNNGSSMNGISPVLNIRIPINASFVPKNRKVLPFVIRDQTRMMIGS
jgi:hypothetical protein